MAVRTCFIFWGGRELVHKCSNAIDLKVSIGYSGSPSSSEWPQLFICRAPRENIANQFLLHFLIWVVCSSGLVGHFLFWGFDVLCLLPSVLSLSLSLVWWVHQLCQHKVSHPQEVEQGKSRTFFLLCDPKY